MTEDKKAYLPLIVEHLKRIGIQKVILFGSLASDNANPNSDIDLIVVTNEDHMPSSHREKSDLYLKVSSVLDNIIKQVPLDLIVYTKPMYSKFVELGSLFSKDIEQNGIVLYEADN